MPLELRPATQEDYFYFYGKDAVFSVKAYVLEYQGRLAGIGGLVLTPGKRTFFLHKQEELPKIVIWRAIKEGIRLLRNERLPVLAIRDKNLPSSKRLLEKLGFTYIDGIEEEVYIL